MNSKVYKWCAVPQCKNTTIKTPNKVFVSVPRKKIIKDKWLKLARRNPNDLVTDSALYFCEDHFDLPNDMENYMEYHVMGSVSRVIMKPGCMPKKFICQPDRIKRTSATTVRPYTAKKQRKLILEECKKSMEEIYILSSMETSIVTEQSSEVIASSSSEAYLCRCCLNCKGTKVLTSSYTSDCGQSILYNEMLHYCFGITLSTESKYADGFICYDCVSSLINAYKFKRQIINAETNFNEHCNLGTHIQKNNQHNINIEHIYYKSQNRKGTQNVYTQTVEYSTVNVKNSTRSVKYNTKSIKNNTKRTLSKKNKTQDVKIRKISARIANRQAQLESLQESTESFQETTESFQESTESFQESTESFQESTESFQEPTESFQGSFKCLQASTNTELSHENVNLSEMCHEWKDVKIKTEQEVSDMLSNKYDDVNITEIGFKPKFMDVSDTCIGMDIKGNIITMEIDLVNCMKYKNGLSGKIRLSNGSVPSKINCQSVTDSKFSQSKAKIRLISHDLACLPSQSNQAKDSADLVLQPKENLKPMSNVPSAINVKRDVKMHYNQAELASKVDELRTRQQNINNKLSKTEQKYQEPIVNKLLKEVIDKQPTPIQNNVCDYEIEIDKITEKLIIPPKETTNILTTTSKRTYEVDTQEKYMIEAQENKKQKMETDNADIKRSNRRHTNFGINRINEEICQSNKEGSCTDVLQTVFLCRCCLKCREANYFTTSYEEPELFVQMLHYCFGLTLSNISNTTRWLCNACVCSLMKAYMFKQQVVNAEDNFKTRCSGTSTNHEMWKMEDDKTSKMSYEGLLKLQSLKEKHKLEKQIQQANYNLTELTRKHTLETKRLKCELEGLTSLKINAFTENSMLQILKEYSEFNVKVESKPEIQKDNENITSKDHSYLPALRLSKTNVEIFEMIKIVLKTEIAKALSLGVKHFESANVKETKNVYSQTITYNIKNCNKRNINNTHDTEYTPVRRALVLLFAENKQKQIESEQKSESFQEQTESIQESTGSFHELTESFQEQTESFLKTTESFQEPTESFQEQTESFQEPTESLQVSFKYLQERTDIESFNENEDLSEMSNEWKEEIKAEQVVSDMLSNEYNDVKDEFFGVDIKDEFEYYRIKFKDGGV